MQKKISGSCFMPVFNLHPIAMHCSAQHTALHHLTYCTCAQYTLHSPEFQCKLRSLDKTVKMSAVQFSSEASDSFCCSCTGASPLLLRCLFHTFLLHKYLMLASEISSEKYLSTLLESKILLDSFKLTSWLKHLRETFKKLRREKLRPKNTTPSDP